MKRKPRDGFAGPLDSFLDIVTNGLGMLILVTTVTMLSNQETLGQFRTNLGTPIIQAAPPELKPVYFECRDEHIYPIEIEPLRGDIDALFNFSPPLDKKLAMARDFNGRGVTTAFHKVEMRAQPAILEVIYKPVGKPAGFGRKAMEEFGQYLHRWKTQEKYLFFLVRSCSFAAFREARNVAKAKGFQIGWDPMKVDRELVIFFGGFGKSSGKIDR